MNRKGYVLLELIISMVFIFIVLINVISLSLDLSKKMNSIYKHNNIINNINIISNDIGYDLYNNNSIDCNNLEINNKKVEIINNKLVYGTKEYNTKHIKFNNIVCSDFNGYYKFTIKYNNNESVELYSLKKV